MPVAKTLSNNNSAHPETFTRLQRLLLGFSLMLIAFNLRPVFASLSVLLPDIIHTTRLSSAGAGYLTTLPVLCLGLFAPLAPRLSQRIGPEKTLLTALFVLAIGTALRGAGDMTSLFLGTALAGAAIATVNVLLPSVVKRDFSDHAALMTGLYTMTLCGGAAVAAATTLPLAHALNDSWRFGLAVWALPAVLVLIIWLPQSLRNQKKTINTQERITGLWRDRLAWQVTFFMGLQSALAYCVMGWMAPILRERGLSGIDAGLVVSVSIMLQVVACLLVPPIAMRCKNQSALNVILAATATAALLGILFAPLSMVWVWAILQGLGQGGLFAGAMTLIVLRSRDSRVAAHLSGMAQGVGYILAAFGPLLIGVLHSKTGSFNSAGWLIAFLGAGVAFNGWGAGRASYVLTNAGRR